MRCFESLLRAAAHSGPLPPLPNHSTSWIPVSRNVFKSAAQGSRVLAGPDWSTLAMKMLDSGDVSDHPYQAQFQAFFDSLDAGVEMPLTSLREASKTFDVIFAADRSSAAGGQVVRLA